MKKLQRLFERIQDLYYDLVDIYRYRAIGFIRVQKHEIRKFLAKRFNTIIYYSYSSTDCDMCTSAGVGYCLSQKSYQEYESNLYEWAEGPTYIQKISEQEYLQHKNKHYFQDRILEAYENGNGRSIIV